MENTNTASAAGISKQRHFDRISESLNKAKAITCLMAYAVAEGSFTFGEEVIWAQQVVSGLQAGVLNQIGIEIKPHHAKYHS